jgi:hypothetical protein
VFVVLAGHLRRFEAGAAPVATSGERIRSAKRPFATPALDEMTGPAEAGVFAEGEAELVFIPRSVVLQGATARVFDRAGVEIVPLAGARGEAGRGATGGRGR